MTGVQTCALPISAGQYLFKYAGLAIQGRSLSDSFWILATLPQFYLSLAIYGGATLLWIYVLSRIPLMIAYPSMLAGAAIVPLIGWFAFGERVGPMFWPGLALVGAGLFMIQLSARG